MTLSGVEEAAPLLTATRLQAYKSFIFLLGLPTCACIGERESNHAASQGRINKWNVNVSLVVNLVFVWRGGSTSPRKRVNATAFLYGGN